MTRSLLYRTISSGCRVAALSLSLLIAACSEAPLVEVNVQDRAPGSVKPRATASFAAADWPVYGGDQAASQYSALTQINTDTAGSLQLAWRYASAGGTEIPVASELQVNPLIVDGVLYGRNPNYNVFAVDASTGEELWTYQPRAEYAGTSYMRGLTLWNSASKQAADTSSSRRLFFSTGHWLFALDATNGKPLAGFGNNGVVDLRAGLGRDIESVSINAPSPGIVFEDLLIMGSAVLESRGAAPGWVRAYDVNSGELMWTFHTVPLAGELGADTWPAEYLAQAGGANAWAGMSVDEERAMVFVPTGSPTPDFDGSKRHGKNLFGNSVIALDARTGKRRWHFQTVHHDLWDRDLSSAPTLATVKADGKERDVVIQASKQGVLYVLDRDTGEPVFPIREEAVAASDIPGEQSWPTQPRVTLPEPFSRQSFTADDISDINEETKTYVTKLYKQAKEFSYFAPIGVQKTILFPGFYGGGNWGGGAYDPASNQYFINGTEVPALINFEKLEPKNSSNSAGEVLFRRQCSGCHGMQLKGFYPYAPELVGVSERLAAKDALATVRKGKGRMMSFGHLPEDELLGVVSYLYQLDRQLNGISKKEDERDVGVNTETSSAKVSYNFAGYNDFLDQRYYPAVKPPWGTLNAFDMASGKRLWQIVLGEHAELSAEGVPPTGTRNYGGPIVTAGGIIAIAATMDSKLRIFAQNSGELLWEYQLPAPGYATPSTYSVDGQQYLVIAASGGKLGSPAGDEYLAFSLPTAPKSSAAK